MKLFVRKPFMSFFLVVVLLIVIAALPEIVIFVIMLGYSISGPIWWIIKFSRQTAQRATGKKQTKQEKPQALDKDK